MSVKTAKSGFGMLELMLAMVATSIMALMVGSMLVYGWQGWKRNLDSVNMQRDVSLAMRVIAKEIRRTPLDNIDTSNASSLTCVNDAGTYTFSISGRDLNLQVNGGAPWSLVRDTVVASGFTATKNLVNESVTVSLDLSTGPDDSNTRMVIVTRN